MENKNNTVCMHYYTCYISEEKLCDDSNCECNNSTIGSNISKIKEEKK